MQRTLIIGYGNELRRDDGIGPVVAREVKALGFPNVVCLAAHQLTPEIAAELACVERAIFVDASVIGETVGVRRVEPDGGHGSSAHAGSPESLLALAQQVYGRHPKAWIITVPAHNMDFGEALSAPGRAGADDAVEIIKRLLAPLPSP